MAEVPPGGTATGPDAQPTDADVMLTYAEIAQEAKVPERSVRRWVAEGDLRAFQLGRHRRILRSDWLAYRNSRYVKAAA